MLIPDCPYCGSKDGVYVNNYISGWEKRMWYNSNEGEHVELEIDLDNIKARENKLIRCIGCNNCRKDIKKEDLEK